MCITVSQSYMLIYSDVLLDPVPKILSLLRWKTTISFLFSFICDENLPLVVQSSSSLLGSCGRGDSRPITTATLNLPVKAEKPHRWLPVFVSPLSHDTGFHGNSGANVLKVKGDESDQWSSLSLEVYHVMFEFKADSKHYDTATEAGYQPTFLILSLKHLNVLN